MVGVLVTVRVSVAVVVTVGVLSGVAVEVNVGSIYWVFEGTGVEVKF